MQNTKIDWATHVWNPIVGCTPISEGCLNCYAKEVMSRFGSRFNPPSDDFSKVTMFPHRLAEPSHAYHSKRIFICSMSDLFHDDVTEEFINQVLTAVQTYTKHKYIILTKRPERALRVMNKFREKEPFQRNLWVGVTAENQARAEERIPILLEIPVLHRFVCVEPMLSPINLLSVNGRDVISTTSKGRSQYVPAIEWVICGGETGLKARPIEYDWVISLRDQCDARVPFWFKKWGHNPQINGEFVNDLYSNNSVDGAIWHQLPEGLKLKWEL